MVSEWRKLGKVVFLGATVPIFAQAPWYELKNRPGANFYTVRQAFQEFKSQQAAAVDLTSLLLNDPDLYELADDFHFRRWADYVEPRVAPSGDLSLLDIGRQEVL